MVAIGSPQGKYEVEARANWDLLRDDAIDTCMMSVMHGANGATGTVRQSTRV